MKRNPIRITHLSVRFTLWYSLLAVAAFGCIIAIFLTQYSQQVLHEKDNVIHQKLELISASVDSAIADVRAVHTQLNNNHLLREAMGAINGNEEHDELQIAVISTLARNQRDAAGSAYQSIILTAAEGRVLDSLYRLSTYAPYFDGKQSALGQFICRGRYSAFSRPNAFPYPARPDGDEGNSTITYYGAYYAHPSFERLGNVVINMNLHRFFAEARPLCESTFDAGYILDEDGNVVLQTGSVMNEELLAALKPGENRAVRINGEAYSLYASRVNAYSSWRIVGAVDQNVLMGEVIAMRNALLFVSGLLIALIVMVSFMIARRITGPIRQINAAMIQLERGTWPQPIERHTRDEIDTLVTGFNRMASAVEHLTGDIVREQEKQKQQEVAMLRSRLDLLQNQINPHFIHNTLNAMNYLALRDGNENLSTMITSFNALLRMSVSTQVEFVSVVQEVEYVNCYMNIQLNRYDANLIDFRTYVDPELAEAMVPKLILQPLVENALFHGILPTGRLGRIAVTCLKEDGELRVTVSDDGVGIDPKMLENILHNDFPNPRGYNGIGLKNVKERLELHYGASCRFQVASAHGLGTMIQFSLPLLREKECE